MSAWPRIATCLHTVFSERATGALPPKVAVGISAVLNLVGAFLSVEVAKTISGGIVDDTKVTPAVIFAGLVGAIVWNLATWLWGLPSSSSHALFGLARARHQRRAEDHGRDHADADLLRRTGIRVVPAGVGHPDRGQRDRTRHLLRRLADHPDDGPQAHRDPDAARLRRGDQCGRRHPHLVAPRFALSTTHVSSGGIIGSGVGRRLAEVRWGVAGRLVLAWVVTLPAAAAVGALAAVLATKGDLGTLVVGVVGLAFALGVYVLSHSDPVKPRHIPAQEQQETTAVPV
jgi:hypothetical protein